MNDLDFQGLSRAEAILENMLGATNNLKPPQSRVEALLIRLLELIEDISHGSGTVFRFVGEKEYVNDLPETGNEQGDVWFVKEKMAGFIWIVREDYPDGYWEELGEIIDTDSLEPTKFGFGYATCSTAAATVAKTASLSSYALNTGGIVVVKFTNAVPANATLNINSKGAKAIYYKGAAIIDGVIKAGDTVTFMYSTQYHVLSIDRDEAPVTSVDGQTGDIWLGNTYLDLADAAAFENLLYNAGAVRIPIAALGQNMVAMVGSYATPIALFDLFTSAQKVIFATVVDNGNGWEPDGRVFEMDSQDPSTGQLDLHCVKAGVLYQITLNYDGTQYAGTITQTNLALPSAQGVSF